MRARIKSGRSRKRGRYEVVELLFLEVYLLELLFLLLLKLIDVGLERFYFPVKCSGVS